MSKSRQNFPDWQLAVRESRAKARYGIVVALCHGDQELGFRRHPNAKASDIVKTADAIMALMYPEDYKDDDTRLADVLEELQWCLGWFLRQENLVSPNNDRMCRIEAAIAKAEGKDDDES